jgi:hypothetical protein
MANQNRRLTRTIKASIKKLKRGEIPYPPPPKTTSAEEEEQFWRELEHHRQWVQKHRKRLSGNGSRAGYKRFLALDEELARLEELFKSRPRIEEDPRAPST